MTKTASKTDKNANATVKGDEGGQASQPVEGEGSYTATHNYNEGLAKSVEEGRAAELGTAARKALEGPDAASLREAERFAKAGHPQTKRG